MCLIVCFAFVTYGFAYDETMMEDNDGMRRCRSEIDVQ